MSSGWMHGSMYYVHNLDILSTKAQFKGFCISVPTDNFYMYINKNLRSARNS